MRCDVLYKNFRINELKIRYIKVYVIFCDYMYFIDIGYYIVVGFDYLFCFKKNILF